MSRLRRAASPTPLNFDPHGGDPWLIAAAQRRQDGDRVGLEELVRTAPDGRIRAGIVDGAEGVSTAGIPAWAEEWVAADPGSPLARTVRGRMLTHLAWEVRGSGWGSTVSRAEADYFVEVLRAADTELLNAARMDPASELPWAFLITTAMGLGIALDEVRDRHREVEQRSPGNLPAANAMVQVLAPKWCGSREILLEFVRDISARAPEGSPMHGLVAQAHIELILSDSDWARNGWVLPDVKAALQRSRLADPTYGVDAVGDSARNRFACCLHLLGDHQAAGSLLRTLGWDPQRLRTEPWDYFGDPQQEIWTAGRLARVW